MCPSEPLEAKTVGRFALIVHTTLPFTDQWLAVRNNGPNNHTISPYNNQGSDEVDSSNDDRTVYPARFLLPRKTLGVVKLSANGRDKEKRLEK